MQKENGNKSKQWRIYSFSRSKYDFARDLILQQFEKGLNALIEEIKIYSA
jgi:hypothetical protein